MKVKKGNASQTPRTIPKSFEFGKKRGEDGTEACGGKFLAEHVIAEFPTSGRTET